MDVKFSGDRLNSKVDCLQDCSECELYEKIEYSIEVQDDK